MSSLNKLNRKIVIKSKVSADNFLTTKIKHYLLQNMEIPTLSRSDRICQMNGVSTQSFLIAN